MKRSLGIAGLCIAFLTGILACTKEEKKMDATDQESMKAEALAEETLRKKEVITGLSLEQQSLDLRTKAAGEKLEKQGNKTRKKLKAKFAAVESDRGKLTDDMERLGLLAEPDFTAESNRIKSLQDSLTKALGNLEKSMK